MSDTDEVEFLPPPWVAMMQALADQAEAEHETEEG